MFLTNLLFKAPKSKHILVLMESTVSGHQFTAARERLADKYEILWYDPYIQQKALYRERKKLKSLSPHFKMKRKILESLGVEIPASVLQDKR